MRPTRGLARQREHPCLVHLDPRRAQPLDHLIHAVATRQAHVAQSLLQARQIAHAIAQHVHLGIFPRADFHAGNHPNAQPFPRLFRLCQARNRIVVGHGDQLEPQFRCVFNQLRRRIGAVRGGRMRV